jgi:hypothetical protein
VDDQQEPQAQVRPALADLVLTSTLSVPAGLVLERLTLALDLRRRLGLRVMLQHLDVPSQSSSSRLARSMLKPFRTTIRMTAMSVRFSGNV